MSYFVVEKHGNQLYLYEYRSVRVNGQPKKVYVDYHGPVNETVTDRVHRDLADPETDISKLNDAFTHDRRITTFDLETTGLTNDDQIAEFSATKHRFRDGKLTEYASFYEGAWTDREFHPAATQATGKTRADYEGCRHTDEVNRDFRRLLGKCPKLAGFNLEFDTRMLNRAARGGGYPELTREKAIDAHDISRAIHPRARSHTLGSSLKRERITPEGKLHGARTDDRATARLIERYARKIDAISKIKPRKIA